jgi:hypothetical protein
MRLRNVWTVVRFDPFRVGPRNIDFGLIDTEGSISGLLGLDILMEAKLFSRMA